MEFDLSNIIDTPNFVQSLMALDRDISVWQDYLETLKSEILIRYPSQEHPVIVHTLGCPASGKTTLLKYCRDQGLLPTDSFALGFDGIMEAFPVYQSDVAEHGLKVAYERWEIPARAMGYELLAFLLEKRMNIAFEHSGARADHITLLNAIKQQLGYRVVMIDTQCNTELALQRAENRTRYLPPEYIQERRKIIEQFRPEYYLLADEIRLYNTETFPPVLLETP